MKGSRWIVIVCISVLAVVLHSYFYITPWGQRLEYFALDRWFNLRGPIAAPEDVILVAMDEDSYQELGIPFNSAWPRQIHAELLIRLSEAGAKMAVFDILFLGKGQDPLADRDLAEGFLLMPSVIGVDVGRSVGAHDIEQLLFPYEVFRELAYKNALVAMPEDYGHIRRFKVGRSEMANQLPSLAEAAAELNHKNRAQLPGPRDLIKYYGPKGAIKTYSYHEVLDLDMVSDEDLKGKTVFVGLALRTGIGPAQKDTFLTSFNKRGRTFGVEIHATAAANLLEGDWIRRNSLTWELRVLSALAFFVTVFICMVPPIWGGLFLILSSCSWAAYSYILFKSGFFFPGALLFIVVVPFLYLGSTLYYYLIGLRAQRLAEQAFSAYLSPEMAKEMRLNPHALELGGDDVVATALFTDIANFTKTSEQMTGQEVSKMLNAYFTDVMGVVFDNKGTLIKFIGDAIFALWGAPIKSEDHVDLALQSALLIDKGVKEFNAAGEYPELPTRIGLHTGPMVVGNLGSNRRFDFTAIGDAVNLAARVEGLNKYFGTTILVTEDSKNCLQDSYNLLYLGKVQVVGKEIAVGLYTCTLEAFPEKVQSTLAAAIDEFTARNWDKAEELFNSLVEQEQFFSKTAELYRGQMVMLKKEVPEPWSGEIRFTKK